MKKKIVASLCAVLSCGMMAACGTNTANTAAQNPEQPQATPEVKTEEKAEEKTEAVAADTDSAAITASGKMVIGITIYEPMNYYDEQGNLTGFDTDFANAVCEKLGVTPEFQVIDWDMKETELKSKNIDCIWNGLTVTEDRKENMDFTKPYLTNKQSIVINSKNAATYTDTASMASAILSAESGSAGESAIQADPELSKASYTASGSQADALLGLNAGNYDAIVIDYTMAKASAGTGDYKDLQMVEGITLMDEQYAIGFRVGSDMTQKVDEVIDAMIADGSLEAIAEKYDMTDLYKAAVDAQ